MIALAYHLLWQAQFYIEIILNYHEKIDGKVDHE